MDDVPYPGTPSSFDIVVFRGSKEGLLKGGLTEDDITDLRTLYEDLRGVCNRARERGVRVCLLNQLPTGEWIVY